MHMRIVHGHRNLAREYIPLGLVVCPARGTNFRERLRLIAHLSDSRRPKCASSLLDLLPKLSPEEMALADEQDRVT